MHGKTVHELFGASLLEFQIELGLFDDDSARAVPEKTGARCE
jgi:hypothetical protein